MIGSKRRIFPDLIAASGGGVALACLAAWMQLAALLGTAIPPHVEDR